MNDPRFGKAFRCPCQTEVHRARRTDWLLSIDGLTPTERTLRFELLWVHPGNQMAIETVERALVAKRGMVTLLGPPGTGKTRLLCCAVNAARQVNIPAVYTTLTDLLDYLRSAYDPNRAQPLNFDARWEVLVTAEVLALDELDEFSATAWALERFQRLIDERWRTMDTRLTLLASNSRLSAFPPKVSSRLNDGRASVVELGGRDLRPLHDWDATES